MGDQKTYQHGDKKKDKPPVPVHQQASQEQEPGPGRASVRRFAASPAGRAASPAGQAAVLQQLAGNQQINRILRARREPGQEPRAPGMAVSHPQDAAGKEAVASKVTGERPPTAGDNSPGEAPRIVHEVLRGPGAPLDAATRGLMEERLGASFSHVRVHTGARAAASARAINALAYTHGSSVVFDSGRYAPHNEEGRNLLAHELAHTEQHGRTGPPSSDQRLSVESPHSPAESQARAIAQAAGTPAVHSPLGAPRASVARAINIGGQNITHGSRTGVGNLFNQVVLPELEKEGYKPYGVKTRLVEFVRINGATYGATYKDDAAFLAAFGKWLAGQTRTVRGGTTPVLKKFDVKKMSRPAWPEALKTLKGVQAGDNVRHVVRNATLKQALAAAFNLVPPDARKTYFTKIAVALDIGLGQNATLDEIVKRIYNALYLNVDNLFSGEGSMNQVIGFSADPVRLYGEHLIQRGEEEIDILAVYKDVKDLIGAAAKKVKADPAHKQNLLVAIDSTVTEAIMSLMEGGGTTVAAEVAGELVADIGLGFGFDLIEGRVPEDIDDIGKRQGRLLWSERELGAFIKSGGTSGNLLDILKVFMGKSDTPMTV